MFSNIKVKNKCKRKFRLSCESGAGFTLIELIVVMAVFLLIMGTAISIFISIVQHQRRIMAQEELLNQASYFVEYMTKGLRMAGKAQTDDCIGEGYVYQLEDFSDGVWKGIKFINQSDPDIAHPEGACQKFCLDASTPENPVLKEIKNSAGSWDCSTGTNVTSTNLSIESLNFSLNGLIPGLGDDHVPITGDLSQPRATISLNIKTQADINHVATKIQTTVSQRDLNVE